MSISTSTQEIRTTVRAAAKAAADVAFKGLPAMRAAMHGARIGAGSAFTASVVERLGMTIAPEAAHALGVAVARAAGVPGIVLQRGGMMLRAGAREVAMHTKEGLSLTVSANGAKAAATRGAVAAIAKTTVRGALVGVGRAAFQGAAAGAVLDGAIGGFTAFRAVQNGEMDRNAAVKFVGMSVARGAVIGGVGVAAAAAISAGIAATGFSIIGAPVVIPLATMVTAGAFAGRVFDRVVRRRRVETVSAMPLPII